MLSINISSEIEHKFQHIIEDNFNGDYEFAFQKILPLLEDELQPVLFINRKDAETQSFDKDKVSEVFVKNIFKTELVAQ
jgi:hypothetical protein